MFVDVGSTFWQQKMKLWLSFFPQNFELKIAKFSSDNSLISLRDINRHQIWGQKVGVAALCPSSKKFSIFGTDRDMNHNLSLKICVWRKFSFFFAEKMSISLVAATAENVKSSFSTKVNNISENKQFVKINFLSSAFLYSVC